MLDTNNHICTQSLNKIDVQKNRVTAYNRIVSRILVFELGSIVTVYCYTD